MTTLLVAILLMTNLLVAMMLVARLWSCTYMTRDTRLFLLADV